MKPDDVLTVYATKLLCNYENVLMFHYGTYGHVLTEKDFKLIKKQGYLGAEIKREQIVKLRDFLNGILEHEQTN